MTTLPYLLAPTDALPELNDFLALLINFSVNEVDSHTTIIGSKTSVHPRKFYLIKDMQVPPEDHQNLNQIIEILSMHQELSNKYLLTLLHHEIRTSLSMNDDNGSLYNSSTMQTNKSIQAVYEYGELSLKQEIETRVSSNAFFEEDELWAILVTIVKALGYLQERGIIYGVLNSDKIFINPADHNVKLLDPSAAASDPRKITEGRLYSPEILNDEKEIDMFKSDMFVAGLIIL